jgi:hypothetical protein
MVEGIEKLREDFKSFRKGDKSALSIKQSALALLDVAKSKGDVKAVDEIKDMLMDLEFSLDENQCNCHRENSCC